ncbi:hypothetical protein BC833DRAFT_599960 [Globomyces pollinis-pini]|nr:hypothetical protein BC833DRAFT_599960 [Globomyces pollinis-pini]
MAGHWNSTDDLTWKLSAILSFIWVVATIFECSFRFKCNRFWSIVAISLLLISQKLYLTILYNEILQIDTKRAANYYTILEYVNILVYICKALGMYQRKTILCPTKYWDKAMLIAVSAFSIIASGTCLLGDAGSCWVYSGPLQCISIFLTIIYFDIYYIYSVMNKFDQKFSRRDKLTLMLPVYWTILYSIMYLIGSITYNLGLANFYTNLFWNFSSVMIPIVVLRSNISTNVCAFVEEIVNRLCINACSIKSWV